MMSALPHQPDAAPEAEAVDGGDDRDLAVVDGGEGGGAAPVGADQGVVALGLDLLDVDAGAEAPALGPQHHDPHLRIAAGGDERRRPARTSRPRRGR